MSEKWVVPLLLGGTAIGVGGYIIYQTLGGGRQRKELEDQWKTVYDDYVKEYTEYIKETGGALTASQEKLLDQKLQHLTVIENNLMSLTNSLWSVLAPVFIGAAAVIILRYFPYEKVSRAITYYRNNSSRVLNSDGLISLTRTAINVCYADLGQVSLATAAEDSTQMWVTNTLYPQMQATAQVLTAQLPTLIGFQLTMAQYLINAIQVQMTSTIPLLLQIVNGILSMPPPVLALRVQPTFQLGRPHRDTYPLLYP